MRPTCAQHLFFLLLVAASVSFVLAVREDAPEVERNIFNCDPRAHPPPPGCIFPSGKLNYLLTFTPQITLVPGDSHNTRVHYYFPPNFNATQRLMFLFHGEHGTATDWFKIVDMAKFTNQAVAEGFAIVALDSFQNKLKKGLWSFNGLSANRDFQNVQAVISMLKQLGLMGNLTKFDYGHDFEGDAEARGKHRGAEKGQETPQGVRLYAAGLNNGGEFAQVVAFYQGLTGIVTFGAAPFSLALQEERYRTATSWVRGQRDNDARKGTLGTLAAAEASYTTLGSAPKFVRTQFCIFPPEPIAGSHYFDSVPGISKGVSKKVFETLKATGWLSEHNSVTKDPTQHNEQLIADLKNDLGKDPGDEKLHQVFILLKEAWGGNAVSDYDNDNVFNFLLRRKPQCTVCTPKCSELPVFIDYNTPHLPLS